MDTNKDKEVSSRGGAARRCAVLEGPHPNTFTGSLLFWFEHQEAQGHCTERWPSITGAHESPADFIRRRNRLSSSLCRQMGWWSARWWRRSWEWDSHIRRLRNSGLWSHALVQWHDEAWLDERRAFARGNSLWASRTRTRAFRGRVHQRWEAGIQLASGLCS